MSDIVPFETGDFEGVAPTSYSQPISLIRYNSGVGPTEVVLESVSGYGTCVLCADRPCIELPDSENALQSKLAELPGARLDRLCPTSAIELGSDPQMPIVDPDLCIGCGLCVLTCSYGAISMTESGVAYIETCDPSGLLIEGASCPPSFIEVERVGAIYLDECDSFRQIGEQVLNCSNLELMKLIRGLIWVLGGRCRVGRIGDVNFRVDAVAELPSDVVGLLEFEFGNDAMSVPRNLLEDLAVLNQRLAPGLSYELVGVFLTLPNQRSEYYEVVMDVMNVLGIKIHTISVGALMLLAWRFFRFEFSQALFVRDSEPNSFIAIAFDEVGENVDDLDELYPGCLTVLK